MIRIEGTSAQKYELPPGLHVMIETQRGFCLIPWESNHARSGTSASKAAFLAAAVLIGIWEEVEGLGGDF